MRGPRSIEDRASCPACGRSVDRREAVEYDRFGDGSERGNETIEYFCEPCHASLDHRRRGDLEALLVDVNAGGCDRETFLRRYCRAVERRGQKRREQ